ncbi:hypothetical protein H0H92_009452 [Tricholoma furcatifolium]|nr:hypothetical protein H0H92_009452 [Tricholoma furcatifolium]
MFRALTVAALAGYVSATSEAHETLVHVDIRLDNADARACIKPSSLLPVLVGMGNGPESIVGYLDTWLGDMCAAPACSDATLSAVITNLTNSCSDEFGLDSSSMQQTISSFQAGYQTYRDVACLRDTNSSDINCVTGTLRNIEAITGAMSLNDTDLTSISSVATKGFPSSVVCTNCMKGAYTIINQNLPGTIASNVTSYVTGLCGASFANGGIPPGLVETAYNASAVSTSTSTSAAPVYTSTSTSTPSPTATPIANYSNGALSHASVLSSGAVLALSGIVALFVGFV